MKDVFNISSEINISAGNHDREFCPVSFILSKRLCWRKTSRHLFCSMKPIMKCLIKQLIVVSNSPDSCMIPNNAGMNFTIWPKTRKSCKIYTLINIFQILDSR